MTTAITIITIIAAPVKLKYIIHISTKTVIISKTHI